MIQTSLSQLIVLNLCALLGVLTLVWAGRVAAERLAERRRRRHRVVCGVCGHVFRDASGAAVLDCPACGRRVERQEVLDL